MTTQPPDNEEDGGSESSYSESEIYSQDEDSSFSSAQSSTGSCSLDSMGRMLEQLEEDDPSLIEILIDIKRTDKEAAKFISELLPSNTHVKKIIIKCGTRPSHRQKFLKVISGLKENTPIQHIEIQDADIDREMASWLVPLFAHTTLQHIGMKNCNFIGAAVSILFVALQHNKHIRHLTFRTCDWEEHNTDTIASSISFLNLRSLTLDGINIAEESWPFLLQQITDCTDLTLLDLSRNALDASNTPFLTKCLTAQKLISTLVLTDCCLNDKCVKEFARGLRKYSTLVDFDISQNKHITDKGVVYLKDLLKFNTSIKKLKVDGCGLNKKSIDAIESGLRYNNSFLKSFFSETTSKTIFGVVDSIEQIDIEETTKSLVAAVSFDSDRSPSHRQESMKGNRKTDSSNNSASRLRRTRPRPRMRPPPAVGETNNGETKSTKGKRMLL